MAKSLLLIYVNRLNVSRMSIYCLVSAWCSTITRDLCCELNPIPPQHDSYVRYMRHLKLEPCHEKICEGV